MGPQKQADQRELTGKFKVVKFLGKGSYGSVFLVQRLGDGQLYALKEMDVKAMSQVEREDSVNEIRLLASIVHPNVLAFHEAFLDGNRLCIIMEYAGNGDLSKVIKKYQMMKKPMPEEVIWKIFIQIARGIQALHHLKVLHRDIKPGNIMMMEDNVVKIGDLGISKLLKHTMAKTQIGTPHYMPPEIWRSKPYSFTSDSWALGCLLYEMATFTVPFEARSMNELRYKVLRGSYPPVPSIYSRHLQQMVRDCLEQVPERRPSMDQILSSAAVTQALSKLPSEMTRVPPSTAGSVLIDTIKVPRNFALIKGKLPPANYESGMEMIAEESGHHAVDKLEVSKLPTSVQHHGRHSDYSALPAIAAQRGGGGDGGYEKEEARAPVPEARPRPSAAEALPRMPPQPPKGIPPHPQLAAQLPGLWFPMKTPSISENAKYGNFYQKEGNGYSVVNTPERQPSRSNLETPLVPAKYQYKGYYDPYHANSGYPNYKAPPSYGGGNVYSGYNTPSVASHNPQNDVKLPPLIPRVAGVAASPMPPWNYGGAPSKQGKRGKVTSGPEAMQAYHNGESSQMPRYPPPQWVPKPAR